MPPSQPQLTDISYAVLGMLSLGARSGYEVKRWMDRSAPHFFAISPPQVYGELKRLETGRFVSGREDPGSARRRRLYKITPSGKAALTEWLKTPIDLTLEMRDKGMLRLFFADLAGTETAVELLDAMRDRSLRAIQRFEREMQPAGRRLREEEGFEFPELTTRIGIDFHRWLAEWCCQLERELKGPT